MNNSRQEVFASWRFLTQLPPGVVLSCIKGPGKRLNFCPGFDLLSSAELVFNVERIESSVSL